MARVVEEMSVAELERALNNRKTLLERAIQKRDHLKSQLDAVDNDIAVLEGRRPAPGSFGPRHPAPLRAKNAKSLHQVVTDVLTENKKGLPLAGLHNAVLETGYKTHSKNFKNVLYQCLYNAKEFEHDPGTGRYRLI